MKTSLIGYTGFVGSNISSQFEFTKLYNSKNIDQILGEDFDITVNAGVRAVVWVANQYPKEDLLEIEGLISKIKKTNTKFIVQISTVDVYPVASGVNETERILKEKLAPYGSNRKYLEEFIQAEYPKTHLIVRLPAIYGQGLKKNFLYDLIHRVPPMFTNEKYIETTAMLSPEELILFKSAYAKEKDGNYHIRFQLKDKKFLLLRESLLSKGIDSISFTNSESAFQYYSLKNLWKDIEMCIKHKINLVNLVNEPISSSKLAKEVFGIDFVNDLPQIKHYDIKTIHNNVLGGKEGYLRTQSEVLEEIKEFVNTTI